VIPPYGLGGLGADTAVILRAPLDDDPPDRYGSHSRDWPSAAPVTVTGVSVQPISAAAGSVESTVDREWASTHLVMYAPAGTDVQATDRVVWRGETFEVDGPPKVWIDDVGVTDHVEVSLKMMTG
jgi:hypothetical protein